MKASVSLTTYNHEKFIGQALDSVLMQDVNFEYEIVIGEDCSNVRRICWSTRIASVKSLFRKRIRVDQILYRHTNHARNA
jgi:hypothetical protein